LPRQRSPHEDAPPPATDSESGARPHPPAPSLDGAQRRFLRSRAHPLKPVVFVGEGGVRPAVIRAVDDALATHELIKVRLRQPDDKHAAAEALAAATRAALCGVVGHTVVLYRPDPDEPRLALPRREPKAR